MPDTPPSRDEIGARLEAAEARTEARIAQLGRALELKIASSDHKIDLISSKIDSLVGVISDLEVDM
jgi:hypothetical protein